MPSPPVVCRQVTTTKTRSSSLIERNVAGFGTSNQLETGPDLQMLPSMMRV